MISMPTFSSGMSEVNLAISGIAFIYAVPPPATIPSSTAALVAARAFLFLTFFL